MTFANYVQNFIEHSALKVNSICRGNYWGSWMWILMQQVNYCLHILHCKVFEKKWEYIETMRRIIKVCLNETYSRIWVSKHVWYVSYLEWFETRRWSIAIAFQLCFRVHHQRWRMFRLVKQLRATFLSTFQVSTRKILVNVAYI